MNYLEELVKEELERANAKHISFFPSIEHCLCVLREEKEEVDTENENIKEVYNKIWKDYKDENIDEKDFDRLELFANNIIQEAVQVVAMVRKYKYSKEYMANSGVCILVDEDFNGYSEFNPEKQFVFEGKIYDIVRGNGTPRDCSMCDIKERCEEREENEFCGSRAIYYKQV